MKNKTIALFGGTGNTGKVFKKLALDQGYKLKILVRIAVKTLETDPNVVYVTGDFSNFSAIRETTEGCDVVVCMGSALNSSDKYLMSNFIILLFEAMKETGTAKLVYQAGALNYLPNKKKMLSVWIFRNSIGKFSGALDALLDHERVFAYFEQVVKQHGIQIIVTLPGALGLTKGDSKKDLTEYKSIVWSQSRYIDVAKFTLKAIENESNWNTYLYIG
jgi:nucleoside-diphosphate-sugar epimerase